MAIVQCARCGKVVPHTEAFYSPEGQICSVCKGVDEVKEGWRNPVVRASTLALGAGLLALGANWFFIFSIVALLAGTASVYMHVKPTESIERWLEDRRIFLFMGGLGLFLGLLTLVLPYIVALLPWQWPLG